MRCSEFCLVGLVFFGCAARSTRVSSVREFETPPQTSAMDAAAFDATTLDAQSDGTRHERRAAPAAEASAADASVIVPRSFAELIASQREFFWRTDSARGAVCTRWSARPSESGAIPYVLSASVTIRCVEYSVTIGARIDPAGSVELRSVGGSVRSRTGGHGWMRAPQSAGTTVSWIDVDEHRVNTSEGPWFLSREACEASSERVPAAAPSGFSTTLVPSDAIASASNTSELRWVIASHPSSGPPPSVVESVERLFRDANTVWEPTVDRASCRSWTVRINGEQRATLERTLPARRGMRETQHVHLAWRPSCGEFDQSGCSVTFAGRGTMGGAMASSHEGVLYVDRAGADWIEVGELRLHSTREGCLRSSARRAGPMITACD